MMNLKITFPVLLALASAGLLPAQPAAETQVQRGKYLVERVGLCADCHTPRDQKGELIQAESLQGDVIGFKPLNPMPWAPVAPGIAGLPQFKTDELAARFLETGTNYAGKLPLPPMPAYRFNHEDAQAVVAYLRSLKH
jgi:mono/diheme cytochrome c family protein